MKTPTSQGKIKEIHNNYDGSEKKLQKNKKSKSHA